MISKVLRPQIITTKILRGITDVKKMYKTSRFHVAVHVYSDDPQRTPRFDVIRLCFNRVHKDDYMKLFVN